MNEQNLIPFNQLSESEQRAIRQKGGKKSGEVRKAKKLLKEELISLLTTKMPDNDGKKETIQKKITLALIQKALNGDVKAFEVIRDTIGEKPAEKTELCGNVDVQKIYITPEEHKQTLEHIQNVINDS